MAIKKIEVTSVHRSEVRTRENVGLRSPGLLARRWIIGLLLVFFGLLTFGGFAYDLFTNGPMLYWDHLLSTRLPAIGLQNPELFKPIMESGYYIGGWVIIILAVIFMVYFIYHHAHQEIVMLLIGLGGETALFEAVSHSIGRHRPPTQIWHILNIPGFPSGHTMASVVFFVFLAYLIVPKVRPFLGKAFIIFLAIFLMLFVGFTRVFTAGHYLTDVLAGYGLGIAWAGISYPMVEIYYRNKRLKNDARERK